MTLPSTVMPASVPDWRASPHDFTLGMPLARVPVMTGAPRLRRVGVGAASTVQADMMCSAAEAEALHAWIEDDLEAAALPFAARLLAPDGSRQWWHARLLEMPRWSAVATGVGTAWQVSAMLRLQGEPSAEAPA